MNLITGESADAFFGGDVPAHVRPLLHQAAVTAWHDQRVALLWTAQVTAPRCLAVYYALYKHHTSRREFALAERAARRGLREAESLAGIDAHGRALPGAALPDFTAAGPARFWLFTRKALAFIALRGGRPGEAREHLACIERICPDARLGDDVVAQLLAAADPARGDAAPTRPDAPAA